MRIFACKTRGCDITGFGNYLLRCVFAGENQIVRAGAQLVGLRTADAGSPAEPCVVVQRRFSVEAHDCDAVFEAFFYKIERIRLFLADIRMRYCDFPRGNSVGESIAEQGVFHVAVYNAAVVKRYGRGSPFSLGNNSVNGRSGFELKR